MSALTIYSGQHIEISHCRDCDIPGYMIISFQRHIFKIHDLSLVERNEFMDGLAFSERALETLFSPEKIYIMRISELNAELHFHIFPRHAFMTNLYLAEHHQDIIDGPCFFSWARKRFYNPQAKPTHEILSAQSRLTNTLKVCFSQPL